MLQSRPVLFGTLEPVESLSVTGKLMEFIKNPVHAALGITVYLIWFLTSNVDAAQKRTEAKLDAANSALAAVTKADSDREAHDRVHDALLRQICIGANRGNAQAQRECGK